MYASPSDAQNLALALAPYILTQPHPFTLGQGTISVDWNDPCTASGMNLIGGDIIPRVNVRVTVRIRGRIFLSRDTSACSRGCVYREDSR